MKTLFTFTICLIFFQIDAQMGYKYQVQVPNGYATKENLSLATDFIDTKGRYIVENGFELYFATQKSNEYLTSIFETVSIPVISINGTKSPISMFEKAGGNDCGAAELLCSNSSQTANSGGAGTQELNGTNQGCLSTEHQSSWYYLNIQTGGTLNMVIDPANNSDDYDFAIWGPFTAATADANCPPITSPIRCSWSAESDQTGLGPYWGQTSLFGCGFLGLSACYGWITPSDNSEGSGGDSWVSTLNVNANEIYILLVDNFSNSGQPYNMSFGGTSVLGCTPVVLPVELSRFVAEKSNKGNILSWTTESENNTSYFSVEWTTNPASNNWTEINNTAAAGDSETETSYTMLHQRPSQVEINYYRLISVDNDGKRKIYENNVISVNNLMESKTIVKMTNLLGQEVDADTKGVIIYYYSDGSNQKFYK